MNKKLIKKLFPIIAVLMLAPWPIAFAYDTQAAAHEAIQITAAEPAAAPKATIFGKAINAIQPGDLFYIKVGQAHDVRAALYITNTRELARDYRYVILKVGVYTRDNNGAWVRAAAADGRTITDTFITLQNGQVNFNLPGGADYKFALDGGSLNCVTTQAVEGNIAPEFYLEVD